MFSISLAALCAQSDLTEEESSHLEKRIFSTLSPKLSTILVTLFPRKYEPQFCSNFPRIAKAVHTND